MFYCFKVNRYTFRGNNTVFLFLPLSERRTALRGRNLLPWEKISFLGSGPQYEGQMFSREADRRLKKFVSIIKMADE